MNALSLATRGRVNMEGIELGTWGRISPPTYILIYYSLRCMIGYLEERLNITGHTERCENV
jgi:hypothetical protein